MDSIDFAKEVPSWLNQELFDKAIRSYEADPQAKVKSFDIKAAAPPGISFGSAVFRAIIKFTSKFHKNEKEMSVIIKTLPVAIDLPNMEHMRDSILFEVEIDAYSNVLGKIQELITGAGYEDIICPRLIYQTLTPNPIIMLEDVKTCGFDKMSRSMHEDYEVSSMVMRRLAKFHAASFYLLDKKSIDTSKFNVCMFTMKNVEKTFDERLDFLLKAMSKWNGFEEFIEPVKKFQKCCAEKVGICHSPSKGARAFNVINHGDFHPKNVLYKMKDDGDKVEDFIMLDFQFCVHASPAVDIMYALYTFVSDENRFTRYDELLGNYYEQFVEALKKFGCLKQPPLLLDLQVEMMKNGIMEPAMLFLIFPGAFMVFHEMPDEDFKDGFKKIKMKFYENDRFKKIVKEHLIRFLNKGILEKY